MSTVKEQDREPANTLPDDATWAQVKYELFVREQIEQGGAAIAEGRTVAHDEIKQRYPSA